MGWTLFFMMVILKIPMVAALWLVWYAIKAEPEPEEDTAEDDRGPRRKLPPLPRWPRRGPVRRRRRLQACSLPAGRSPSASQRPAPAYARRPERV